MHITVVGNGYVGLVTAACLSFIGHRVVGVDNDRRKLASLRKGIAPLYEPGLQRLLTEGMDAGRLSFSEDLATAVCASEVIFIAVGTPGRPDGSVDLTSVEAVAEAIGRALASTTEDRMRVVATKSTMPVGTSARVEEIIRASFEHAVQSTSKVASLERLFVVSNPEFLREGCAISDWLYPDRIVIGSENEQATAVLTEVYGPILRQTFDVPDGLPPRPEGLSRVPLIVTDRRSAELAKYAANALLSTRISFANEIANICERTGADVCEVMRIVGLDHRIGAHYLSAGIGWGGSCLGKDVAALIKTATDQGYEPELLKAVLHTNTQQRHVLVDRLEQLLGGLEGKTVGLLGLAFKPGTDDIRDAPSLTIARTLLERAARVKVYDPVAMPNVRAEYPTLALIYAASELDLAKDCHAVVLVTEWDQFRQLDFHKLRAVMAGTLFVDGRNALDPLMISQAGLNYVGVGRPSCRDQSWLRHAGDKSGRKELCDGKPSSSSLFA